jgi:spermidine dehydrogenase
MSDVKDRELGMLRSITRRDFLNGVAVTAGATMLPSGMLEALESGADPEKSTDYYPPALTGLRGSHVGAFEVMHSLRDGTFWDDAGKPDDTGEDYDLVVVGGGISGLSAAFYYQRAMGGKAKILILENHDDFGGHAKRNEFTVGQRKMLGYGGAFSIESPAPYSAIAKGMVNDLGIDVGSYQRYNHKNLYRAQGLNPHIFFDKETFGADKLVADPSPLSESEGGDLSVNAEDTSHGASQGASKDIWKKFLAEAPLSEKAKQDYVRLHQEKKDYMPGLSSAEKKARLARMSCAKYMTDVVGISPEIVRLYQAAPHSSFGLGLDAVSAQDAWGMGFLGFEGLNLDPEPGPGQNYDAIRSDEAEKYFFHFPDGNASIARLLVRKLIPEAIPGSTAQDVVTARGNYASLDKASSNIRIRLNSSVVRVKHEGDAATAKNVEVAYVRGGKLRAVRGKNCILACWHVVIPYICPDLPETQKDALASAAKVPLLYTNVALNNWTSFKNLGVNYVYAPGSYHTIMTLDLPVSIGDYQCSQKPEDPVVIHLGKTPCKPGLPARDQHRMGRTQLFVTQFATIERNVREQMARTLSAGGFDPARDIAAITVNRWPHGYAYEYNSLWDKFWLEGGEQPCTVARKPFGRIAIANADAAAYSYTDAAIDQAYRAVQEIVKQG